MKLPVWNTTKGNSASQRPTLTSCAARTIRSTLLFGAGPNSPLAIAAHFFLLPRPNIGQQRRNCLGFDAREGNHSINSVSS